MTCRSLATVVMTTSSTPASQHVVQTQKHYSNQSSKCVQYTLHADSLIPRLFLPPVFNHLKYAKTEEEGVGNLITCMVCDIMIGRQIGGGARRRISRPFL